MAIEILDPRFQSSSFVITYRSGRSRLYNLEVRNPQHTTRAVTVRSIINDLPAHAEGSHVFMEVHCRDEQGHDVPVRGHHTGHALVQDRKTMFDIGPFNITESSVDREGALFHFDVSVRLHPGNAVVARIQSDAFTCNLAPSHKSMAIIEKEEGAPDESSAVCGALAPADDGTTWPEVVSHLIAALSVFGVAGYLMFQQMRAFRK
eukprot:ANDGO_02834.mRNA.1 hypothetical protein